MTRCIVLLVSLIFLFCSNSVIENNNSQFGLEYQTGTDMFTVHLTYNDSAKSLARNYCKRADTTVLFQLSDSELTLIKNRLNQISFSSYSDTFQTHQKDSVRIITTPAQVYLLRVKNNNEIKSVYWGSGDFHNQSDSSAIRLKSLFDLIDGIVTSNSQYLALPADDCIYM